MRTFVLSGGGNRGPLQVGAIQALLEHGIYPDMIVGTSAGALNGCLLAMNPKSLAQVEEMGRLWVRAGERKLIASGYVRTLAQLVRGADHLANNKALGNWVRKKIPAGCQTFGSLPIPLFVTATHLRTHTLYVFGDDPTADVVDAVMLSAAVPGIFPPVRLDGEVFVDGGVASNVPVRLATARGATEIWAIDLALDVDMPRKFESSLAILGHSASQMMRANVRHELEEAARDPNVVLHHIPLFEFQGISIGDFVHTPNMIAAGAKAARAYLSQPAPDQVNYPRFVHESDLPKGPKGARPFV